MQGSRSVTTLTRRSPPSSAETKRSRWYATPRGLLRVEAALIILVPTRFVVSALGGIGSPALLLGLYLLMLWGVGVLTGDITAACVPVRATLAALWVALLLSYAVMHIHAAPGDEVGNSDRQMILLLALTGIALCAAETLQTRDDVMATIRTLVNCSAVMAFIAILQFRIGWDPLPYLAKVPGISSTSDFGGVLSRSSFRRPAGTAGHPIEYGVAVSASLALAIHLVIYDVDRPLHRRWLALATIGVGIPIAISRSALLVTFVVLAFFLVGTTPRLRAWASAILACFAVFVFMTVPGLIGTLKSLVVAGNSDSSISTRTSDYAAAEPYVHESPWVGRGPGTFLPKYFILDNQYLASLIEIGVFGVLALTAYLLLSTVLGRGARRRSIHESDRSLGQMLAGAGFAAAFAAAVYDMLAFGMFTLLSGVYLGVTAAFWTIVRLEASGSGEGHPDERGG